MCGIFAYVGENKKSQDLVFKGLKTLEYRGYDSWGIAAKSLKRFVIEKHVGKIGNSKLNGGLRGLSSNLSIGHTRWATHGGVTDKNAHPHLDCTGAVAVMHNGIIENYEEIKRDLIKKGHKFLSETDTEILPHLIEENMKRKGFASSVRDAFNSLKGLNAIVVASALSSEIIAAKTGSPLIIGKGENSFFVSSDSIGLLPYTNKLIFLKDNEMAIIGKGVQIIKLPKGKKIETNFNKVLWKEEHAEKGRFKHFMLKEIYEQPHVLKNIETLSENVKKLTELVKQAKGVFFIGSGTAFNACLAGQYFFSKIAKEHVNTLFASEFNYLEDFLNKKSLVIALSQSGETIDVIEPLNRAKAKGSRIVALVNVLGSTIYRMADYKMLLLAGPEKAVASTKAYVAKLAVLLLLSYSFIGRLSEGKRILQKTYLEIKRILKEENGKIKKIAAKLRDCDHIFTIGRGVSYSTALEAALKIKEVSYIHTEGLAGGELKHGTIALITKGTPCIVFAPDDETYQSIISNTTEIKTRGGFIIGVSSKNSNVFDEWIEVKDVSAGSYIAQIVPAQLLAYYIAVLKKLDPDKPRNLAKSVTVK